MCRATLMWEIIEATGTLEVELMPEVHICNGGEPTTSVDMNGEDADVTADSSDSSQPKANHQEPKANRQKPRASSQPPKANRQKPKAKSAQRATQSLALLDARSAEAYTARL